MAFPISSMLRLSTRTIAFHSGHLLSLLPLKGEEKMTRFPLLDLKTAPEASHAALNYLLGAFGLIPNIASAMATSPVLINTLIGMFRTIHGGSFSELQIQILLLTNAVTNACSWAVAFHTALALNEGLDRADVEAIREGRYPEDAEHAALSRLARKLIEKRGRIDEHDADDFIQGGFDKERLLEVIAVVAASTVTNYTGSVTLPPVDEAFQQYLWKPMAVA
jgi:AhpD family alkylhydroperoxidase